MNVVLQQAFHRLTDFSPHTLSRKRKQCERILSGNWPWPEQESKLPTSLRESDYNNNINILRITTSTLKQRFCPKGWNRCTKGGRSMYKVWSRRSLDKWVFNRLVDSSHDCGQYKPMTRSQPPACCHGFRSGDTYFRVTLGVKRVPGLVLDPWACVFLPFLFMSRLVSTLSS